MNILIQWNVLLFEFDDTSMNVDFVFICAKGEGAPTLRKGTCANHIRDISKVLTGAHLTLNARTEDDIETDRILDKLNSIRFAVKENKPRIEEGEFLLFYFIYI